MPFPDGVETVTVTAGDAGYRTLDGEPYAGTIRFTPSVSRVVSAEHGVIALGPVNATLSASGGFTVGLLAIDADGFEPSGWTYRVDEEFTNAPGRAYSISLPAAAPSVALPALAEVESTDGTVSSPAVLSVNGETGIVTLTAAEVGADAAGTATAAVATHAVASDPHGDRAYSDAVASGKASTATQVIAGTGLSGGGTLAADRTLSVTYGTGAGSAAQGNDSRITGAAQKAANLSDLGNAGTARGNLGLGGAALLNVGTAASTVAAGDDSRITGAAQKAQNLADLASVSSARANLRLAGPFPADYGVLSWSYPPPSTSSSGAGASGTIYFMRVPALTTAPITGVRLFQVSAGSSLTAGQCLVGYYDAAGNRVAVSGDQSSAWMSGAVLNKDGAFTAPYTPVVGDYWAAMLFNGSTGPVWCKGPPGGMINAGWSFGAPYPAMSSAGGQTSLPASVNYSSLGFSGSAFWASTY